MSLLEKKDFECKICLCYFDSLQACLRHDLLKHICLSTNNKKKTQITKLQRLWAMYEDKAHERLKVQQALANCRHGQELQELFKIYCIGSEQKENILKKITAALLADLRSLEDIEINTFGSVANGLMMKNSDIDIYIRTPHTGSTQVDETYHEIVELLRKGKNFTSVIPMPHACVPIIKCRHVGTYFKVDITCACPESVENTKLVREILSFDVRLRTLMRFIKIWATQHQLIGHGVMTCYCLTTLVLFFLQQIQHGKAPLIPSIAKMQSDEPAILIQGVDYSFNVEKHMSPLPPDLHAGNLIRSFFIYYQQFDFHRLMVATHPGVPVALADFKSGKFYYAGYENQLTVMKSTGYGSRAKPLCTERDMVVQDSFQLNENLAKSVTPTHFNYFRQCVENAFRICEKIPAQYDALLYQALLFDLFDVEIVKIPAEVKCTSAVMPTTPTSQITSITSITSPTTITHTTSTAQLSPFVCTLVPNQTATESFTSSPRYSERDVPNPNRQWTQRFIELVWTVFRKIYCLNVHVSRQSSVSVSPSRFDADRAEALKDTMFALDARNICSWVITGSVDMWTGRKYRCIGAQTFVRYQQLLTKAFMLERSKMPEFAIDFNVVLRIHVDNGYGHLKLEFIQHDLPHHSDERKTAALQKFFENFRCIMQSLNVEDKLLLAK